ncbi:MAG: PA14 domain-containing protein [Acidimicrobiales bacterium]
MVAALVTAVALVASLPAAPASSETTTASAKKSLPAPLASSPRPRAKLETPAGDFSKQPPLNDNLAKKDYDKSFDRATSRVTKRAERSTTYENPDGTFTAEITNAPVNWKDASGTWKAIDNTLVAAGGSWKNRSGPVTVSVPDVTGTGPLAALSGDGWSLSFSLDGSKPGVKAKVTDDTATFADVAPDLDLDERVTASGLKEVATLNKRPATAAPYRLRFPLTMSGLTAAEAANGSVTFSDGAGTVVATAPPAWAWDAAENPAEGGGVAVAQRLVPSGAGVAIELTVPGDWLADPARTYPVKIDPTLDAGHQSAQFDAFASSPDPNGNYNGARQWANGSYVDMTGYDSYPSSQQVSYQYFDLAPVFSKNILAAEWRSFAVATTGSGSYRLWPIAQSWGDWSITWNNRPDHTAAFVDGVATAWAWNSRDIKSWVQGWAANPSTSLGIAIDSAGQNSAVRFLATEQGSSLNSAILVTYNTAPTPSEPTAPASGVTVMTDQPTLTSTTSTDPDGSPVTYWYRMSTNPDALTGATVNSGWISSPSWTPPPGVLVDGATYYWQVYSFDGLQLTVQTTPIRKLKVDQRLGDAAVSPTDAVGPVSVNLANGNAVVHAASPAFDTVGGPMGLSYTYNSKAPEQFGLLGTYESVSNGASERMIRKDHQIDFNWPGAPGPSLPAEDFKVTWTGYVTVPYQSNAWSFGAMHDDGVKITVAGSVVLDTAGVSASGEFGSPVTLGANQTVPIRIDYREQIGSAYIQLRVAGPYNGLLPASWLSTSPPALSQGWTLSTDTGGTLAYNQLVIVGNDLVLLDPSGEPHGFTFTGSTADLVNSFTWAPAEAGDGMISMSFDTILNKWLYVAHGEDGVEYSFNIAGQLERAVAVHDDMAKPASPSYSYDPLTGRLRTVTDPVTGHAITLAYGSDPYSPNYSCPANSAAPVGALCRIQYWNATTTDLMYVEDQLARILDPGQAATDFAYSGGRLVGIRDALAADAVSEAQRADDDSVRTAIAYDAGGRVASVTLPAPKAGEARPAHSYAYSYTLPGTSDVTVAGLPTPPATQARRVTYDAAGRATTDRDASGFTTTTSFNDDDQLVSRTDPAGFKTSSVYDHAKRQTESWGPAPAGCFNTSPPVAPPAGFTGEVPNGSCTNPAVPVSRTAFDEGMAGLAATYYANPDLSGSPRAHATGAGDPNGALYQNWGTGAPAGIPSGTDMWSARFTGEVNLPATGFYNFSAYTDNGVRIYVDDRLIGDFWANAPGFTPSATVWGAAGWHRFRVDYHDTGGLAQLELRWSGPGASGTVPGANLRPRYGLVTSTTDADGNRAETEYARPEYGLATATVVDPSGLNLRSTTTYEAPGTGYLRRTERTLPKGAATKVAYEYYAATNDPALANECNGIAVAGMLKRSTDATPASGGAIVRQFVYDALHRVVGRRVATDARWSCVTYDARGRAVSSTDSSAKTSSTNIIGTDYVVTYVDSAGTPRATGGASDLLGHPRTYTDEQGTTTRRTYTQAGGPDTTWRTFSGGVEAVLSTTAYDTAGRPQSFSDSSSNTARTTTYGYDAANGRPTTTTTPNAVVATTGYDPASGAMASINHALSGASLAAWSATRFASGNIKTETVTGRTRTFGYDRAGRLTSVAETTGAGSVTRNYAYDANTNRCSAAGLTCDGNWAYDSADRLTSSPFASAHTYDAHGNLTSATLRPGTTAATAEVITYDANDHALTINDGTTTVDETLAPSGRVLHRVVRTNATGAVTEDVVYGYNGPGDSPAYIRPSGGGAVTTYVAGPAGMVAVDVAGAATYPVVSGHGDMVGTTDLTGAFTALPTADEFGRGAVPTGRLGWLGAHERFSTGASLGLVRMGVRLYDPGVGRFLAVDPVEGGSCSPQNAYDYANSDPLNSIDLGGLFPMSANCVQCRNCLALWGAAIESCRQTYSRFIGAKNALPVCLAATSPTFLPSCARDCADCLRPRGPDSIDPPKIYPPKGPKKPGNRSIPLPGSFGITPPTTRLEPTVVIF